MGGQSFELEVPLRYPRGVVEKAAESRMGALGRGPGWSHRRESHRSLGSKLKPLVNMDHLERGQGGRSLPRG